MKQFRYYTNLSHEKDKRRVTMKSIVDEQSKAKFEDKIKRIENIVECTKDGTICGKEDQNILQAYDQLDNYKQQLQDSLEREVKLKIRIGDLELQLELEEEPVVVVEKEEEEEEEEQTSETVGIKPYEAPHGIVTYKAESVVTDNEIVSDVAVNDDKPIVNEDKPKRKPRGKAMKRRKIKKKVADSK